MEPTALFSMAYESVKVANALIQINQSQHEIHDIKESIVDIHSTLNKVEVYLGVKIYQPLRSGLAMLSDAEAEYQVNQESARELANTALISLNQAEGQLVDVENQVIGVNSLPLTKY
ncbi:MAG: hypothetical protein GY928_23415 [Colwellia sp.]|nr:hypothetical protein [Colwellia sp.]